MVIWSDPARSDLRSIHNFIAHDSKHYAKKVSHEIREKADNLSDFSKTGKIVPELNNENIREVSLYSYRIIYEIKTQDIIVLAVVHKRRNLKPEDI